MEHSATRGRIHRSNWLKARRGNLLPGRPVTTMKDRDNVRYAAEKLWEPKLELRRRGAASPGFSLSNFG